VLLRAVRRFEASIEAVAQVEPPAEDAALIAQWLALERDDVAATRRIAAALRQEQLGKWRRAVKRSRALEREIDALIGDYGFQQCS